MPADARPPAPEGPPVANDSPLFSRLVDHLSTACGVLSAMCVVGILVLVCTEVMLRQFRQSLLVTDEIGGYLNAALVFFGLAYTLRTGGFIRVEIIYDKLPSFLRQAARWIFTLVGTVFVGVIVYYAFLHVRYAYNQDTRAVSVLETPEWIPQSVMVIGLAVLLLQLLAFIVDRVRNVP